MAHCVYDTISGMLESDSLKYVPPSKCLTRLAEITAAKPPEELKLDANATGITVKDSTVDASCPPSTEMDIFEALTRRALAFDAVGLIAFDNCGQVAPLHVPTHEAATASRIQTAWHDSASEGRQASIREDARVVKGRHSSIG